MRATHTGARWLLFWAVVLTAYSSALAGGGGHQPAVASQAVYGQAAGSRQELLKRYCFACHNDRMKTGGLALDTLDATRPGDRAEIWEKVVRKLGAGLMPPAGIPRPDKATYEALVAGLETELDRAAAEHPNPGR